MPDGIPWWATALIVWCAASVFVGLVVGALLSAGKDAPCGPGCECAEDGDAGCPPHRWNTRANALWLGSWLGRHKVPVLPRVINTLFWGRWECRVFGHSLVRAIPWCFRCYAGWDTWEQIPARDYRKQERRTRRQGWGPA